MTSFPRQATARDTFELLHESLIELSAGYVDDVYKPIGFLLLAIGWLITSDKSRAFLRDNLPMRRVAVCTIMVIAPIHFVYMFVSYRRMTGTLALLRELDFMPYEYYAGDRVHAILIAANVAIRIALFIILTLLVYATGKPWPFRDRTLDQYVTHLQRGLTV